MNRTPDGVSVPETDDSPRIPAISGPSSYRIALAGRWILAAWVPASVAMVVTVVLRPGDPQAGYFRLVFSLIGLFGLLGLALLVAAVVVRIQTTRERDAGFTWLPDQYVNLPQIDPVSRRVIRRAGEDFLPADERKRRIADARRAGAGVPSAGTQAYESHGKRRFASNSRHLVDELRSAFPGAPVFRIYGEADFVIALGLLSGRQGKRFPHFGVLVVREGRVELYAGSAAEPVVQIPGRIIERATADPVLTSNGVPRPTVTLAVAGPTGGRVIVPFVVMREAPGSVLPAGIERARAVVASVEAISSRR